MVALLLIRDTNRLMIGLGEFFQGIGELGVIIGLTSPEILQ
jgi:hypothetical protein